MFDHQGTDGLIGRIFDGYRVTEFLARGGMGVVYKAVQESLNRPVAIKFLYPHLSADESFRERFEREARAAAALNHPTIVRILDFGQEDGMHYMVLDFIDGESLRDYLSRLHSEGLLLRVDRAVRILESIGAALAYAHARGFVHRDVKPGNILFTSDGRALLSDFGVVKSVGMSQMTTAGAVIGTPEYVAPEQGMDAAAIGPEADQYALGIVAYEMLTGRVPFQGQTPTAVLRMHISEPPPPPTTFVPWISADAEAVLMRALAKSPGERHESVGAFVERLSTALSQSPTLMGAPTGSWPGQGHAGPPSSGAPPATVAAGEPPTGAPPEAPPASGSEGHRRAIGWPVIAVLVAVFLLAGAAGGFLLARGDDNGGAAALDGTATEAESPSPAEASPTEVEVVDVTETLDAAEPTVTDPPEPTEEPPSTVTEDAETPTTEEVAEVTPEGCFEVILFASHRGEVHDSQIYLMNPDGTNQRQLTFARGHSWGPRIAPDGSQFFFSSVAPGEHEEHTATGGGTEGLGNHQIYLANIDGSDITILTADSTAWDNSWSWSPDGTLITFTSDRDGNWELYTMTVDGDDLVRLTDTSANEGWPSWTPDGRFIVFSSDQTGTSEIYIMDSDGSNVRQLTDRPDTFDTYPYVSPDGSQIVFSSQVPAVNEGEIYVMDIDGSSPPTRLTSTAALNYAPSWSPDGSQIVFVSDRAGHDDIWSMDADGSNQTRLTSAPVENTTPSWGFACAS